MGGIRVVDIVVGYETSTQPTAITPSDDADIITKGYADDTYTPYASVGANVDDITALKAVASADRYDEQLRFVNGLDLFYQFDAASTATPDDDLVVQPTSGTGRWLKVAIGGGGAGGGSGIEQLQQKLENEKSGIFTEALDNSVGQSFKFQPFIETVVGRLLKDTTSGATSLEIAWSPVFVNDSDKDTNSTTGWTATGAGASLTTNGTTKQIGSASLQFDKNNTATEAAIRYDRGSQNLSLGSNSIALFYINLPSITNLSNVLIRVYADTTSNFRTWTKTTTASGGALSTGWNLIRVDLSDTTGSTTGGTGWTSGQQSRYVEIGVTTSSAGQTYAAILVDSLMFSLREVNKLGMNGSEVTVFDNSAKQELILDISNTLYDAGLSLKSGQSTSTTFTGGSVSAVATYVKRCVLVTNYSSATYDSALTSGSISTEQETRLSRILRESMSGSIQSFVDISTPQFYRVTAVGGSTIDVSDTANTSANLLNTNVLHHFKPYYANGVEHFVYQADKTMTANSSHSSGTTTITIPVSGIAVGDLIVKKHISTSASLVSVTSNESFSAMSEDASPNGIKILDNYLGYPQKEKVIAHWKLGAVTNADAVADQRNNIGALTIVATPNLQDSFLYGRYSASTVNGTNRLERSSGNGVLGGQLGRLQFSFWVYVSGNASGDQTMLSAYSGSSGFTFYMQNGSRNMVFTSNVTGTSLGHTFPIGWSHVLFHLNNGVETYAYLNGVKGTTLSNAFSAVDNFAVAGVYNVSSNSWNGHKIADLVVWDRGNQISQQEVMQIYNNGNYRPFETGGIRYSYTANGQSGQKLSMKTSITRSTTAISPALLKMGSLFSE